MATIKVTLNEPLRDGMEVKFQAPCDCTAVTGLTLTYPTDAGTTSSRTMVFMDAHGNRLTGVGNLFMEGSYIKVLADTTNNVAYIQNADTNGYLEGEFEKLRALHLDNGNGCYYRVVDDEFEWINPPMVVGTEYRTTERFASKPVYTAIVTYAPTTSAATVVNFVPPTGVVDLVIRCNGWTSTGILLPYYNNQPTLSAYRDFRVLTTIHDVTRVKRIQVGCEHGATAANAAETWYIQVWYTKE